MRNLKRALSLGLTAAMISGLMVMGSSAASYADVTSENNVEAIEVLESVGIMIGDENGNFNPDQNVTRNEMAVIMSNLMEYNVASYKDTSPFTDVPSWAEPYVAACWTNGITAGYSDTIYGGSDTVTTAQAALMLMKALGYFQYASDFGGDWQLATTRQGNAIDLFDGVDSGVTAPMTRNDVAQLVLNTLEAGTVTASTDGSWSIGDVTIVNNVTYNYVTSNSSYAESIHSVKSTSSTSDADRYVVELGEQLYQGDLRLREGTMDDFGRPSRTWIYENSEIGTYAEDADLTYTAGVESGEIYSDLGLGKNIVADDVTVYVDGEDAASTAIRRNNDTKLPASGNGVLTEVFYDADDNTAIITHVNTWVGTIVKSVAETDDEAAYVVVAPEKEAPAGFSGNEEFETDTEFDDDQYVLYTYSQSSGEIESVTAAEDASGLVTEAENTDTNDTDKAALTIDGTRRTASVKVTGPEDLSDISDGEEYIVYLDSYGYVIYVERVDEIGDYALVLETASPSSFIGNKAIMVFTDGTYDIVDTDKNYHDGKAEDRIDAGTIVTYRVDEDGEYTLRPVAETKASYTADSSVFSMENDKAGIKVDTFEDKKPGTQTVTANSATTFVVRDPSNLGLSSSAEDWTVYTGIKNAPTIAAGVGNNDGSVDAGEHVDVYYYCKSGNMVTVMFILPEALVKIEDGIQNNLFLSKESVSNLIHNSDGDYFRYDAVDNGELVTVKVSENVTINDKPVPGADAVGDSFTSCNHNPDCASYSAHVKATLGGLFAGYTTDKYGVITNLETYNPEADGSDDGYDADSDRLQALQNIRGIDKVSKEYTVILNTYDGDNDGTPDGNVYTITCDEDATFYYVDEDGNITESSYNGVVIDNNDIAYAVIEDYMVQMLVIQEVKAPTSTYGVKFVNAADGDAATYAAYTVNGKTIGASDVLEVADKGDDLYFTIKPVDGYQIDSVSGTGVVDLGNGNYVVRNVKSPVTVTVDVDAIPPETMDVKINYMDGSTKIDSSNIQPFAAYVDGSGNVKSYSVIAEENDYIVVGNKLYQVTETVTEAFQANGYKNVDVPVALVGVEETVITDQIPDALNISWADGDKVTEKGVTYLKDNADTTAALKSGVGTWSSAGVEYTAATVSVDAANETINNLPATTAYGYFKVTVTEAVDISKAGMPGHTVTAALVDVNAVVDADGTATVKINLTDDTKVSNARPITVTATNGTASTTDTFSGNANTPVEITVSLTDVTDDTVLNISLGPQA